MKRLWILGLSAAAVLMVGSFASAAPITVDEFSAVQFLVTGPGAPPKSVSGSVASAGILGGERDAVLTVLSGLSNQGAQAVAFPGSSPDRITSLLAKPDSPNHVSGLGYPRYP